MPYTSLVLTATAATAAQVDTIRTVLAKYSGALQKLQDGKLAAPKMEWF